MKVYKNVKTHNELNGIRIMDIALVLLAWMFSFMMQDIVYDGLRMPFQIFCVVVAILFLRRSRKNLGKKYWQEIVIYFKRDTYIYMPVYDQTRIDERKEELLHGKDGKKHFRTDSHTSV